MKNTKPFFSIVTVVFNDLEGLKSTRKSLISQNFKDFEWIVVDGCSSDGTVNFLSQLKSDTVKWISEKDTGIYDAMNKSLKLCEAYYVLFLNAGDFFSGPSMLEKISSRLLLLDKVPDILFAGATYVFTNGIRWYREPKKYEKYIWHGLPALHQSTFYKRHIFNNTKYDLTYKFCGDYYLASKLFCLGANAIYLDFSVVDFSVGGASYCNPLNIIYEPYLIQKNILKTSLHKRFMSFAKRIFSLFGLYFISIKFIGYLILKTHKTKLNSF